MLPTLETLQYWSLFVFLAIVGLTVLYFVVMGLALLLVRTLLAVAHWHDIRQRNRARKALGLPPLSGIHLWR